MYIFIYLYVCLFLLVFIYKYSSLYKNKSVRCVAFYQKPYIAVFEGSTTQPNMSSSSRHNYLCIYSLIICLLVLLVFIYKYSSLYKNKSVRCVAFYQKPYIAVFEGITTQPNMSSSSRQYILLFILLLYIF